MRIGRFTFALVLILPPARAAAHVLSATQRSAPPLGWTFEPWVVSLMTVSLVFYLAGYWRLRGRSRHAHAAQRRQLLAFIGGWLALVAALESPLDALSAALFSAHMVQHELLMIVAAPLLVVARPFGFWIWALPVGARRRVGRFVHCRPIRSTWHYLTRPALAWVAHAAALWAWHAPRFFEAALAHPAIHTLQHTSFLVSALLFWWTIFGQPQGDRHSGHAMLALFTTMAHTGALGALITLSPGLWYPSYVEPCSALGFDPLHDQQLGGLVMWVPGGLAYLIGGLAISASWLMRRGVTVFPPLASDQSAREHG